MNLIFFFEDLSKKTIHFKNLEKIENIFNFLHEVLNSGKDTLKKENNTIIINIKFPLGNKNEEVSFIILEKKISLESNLKNVCNSLNEINKNNINTKIDLLKTKNDFKKNLLEKVYPIGSYYWSSNNISPSEIFGGTWTQINGRFLFASDSNHSLGLTGGEEYHCLQTNEIPSHAHKFREFVNSTYSLITPQHDWDKKHIIVPGRDNDGSFSSTCSYFLDIRETEKTGRGDRHNNMPPYLTANCWQRIK